MPPELPRIGDHVVLRAPVSTPAIVGELPRQVFLQRQLPHSRLGDPQNDCLFRRTFDLIVLVKPALDDIRRSVPAVSASANNVYRLSPGR